MKILFFGDIIGEKGRKGIKKVLPAWREKYQPDLVIANAENLAHGFGVTEKSVNEVLKAGVDVLTSGNHIFDKKDALILLGNKDIPLIRPANWPPVPHGQGYRIVNVGINRVLIINLNGRLFFRESLDCPFRKVNEVLEELADENLAGIIVDFHAEATSEKASMGHHLDGQVSAVLGTHTHVPTADEKILPGGTAYISDVGMVGPYDSVISFGKQEAIRGWLTQIPGRCEFAEGPVEVDAVLVEIDTKTKLAKNIERIREIVDVD
jgi:metallophosphoesterase (TIGR00282 family)